MDFLETIVLHLQIFIDPYDLAHTAPETCSHQTFNRANLKFGLKLSVCASITSGIVGVSSLNFPDDVPQLGRCDSVFTIIGRSTP